MRHLQRHPIFSIETRSRARPSPMNGWSLCLLIIVSPALVFSLLSILGLALIPIIPEVSHMLIRHNPLLAILLIIVAVLFHSLLTLYLTLQTCHSSLAEKRNGLWDLLCLTSMTSSRIVQGKWYDYLYQARYLLLCEAVLQAGASIYLLRMVDARFFGVVANDVWLHLALLTIIIPIIAILDASLSIALGIAVALITHSISAIWSGLILLRLIVLMGSFSLTLPLLLSRQMNIAQFLLMGLGAASYLILIWICLAGVWMIED